MAPVKSAAGRYDPLHEWLRASPGSAKLERLPVDLRNRAARASNIRLYQREGGDMGSRKVPNPGLRALLAQAGLTGEELARSVNHIGAETGLRLRYRRASVSQWLSGVRPRPPVPELVAEALSRALGRPVTVDEVGLGPGGSQRGAGCGPWWEMDAITSLVWPSCGEASRDEVMAGYVYSPAALSVPDMTELAAMPAPPTPLPAPGRVGRAELAAMTLMTRLVSEADAAFGGGHARPALVAYLATTVASWLRSDVKPARRRELLAAAGRLAYLCGFMCFDEQLHGVAQHYYLASLRLATDASDALGYAVTLRAMSVQARILGHRQQAVDLAETAVRTASATTPTSTRAFLLGQLAVADAATGDRHAAIAHLKAAERSLERAGTPVGPVGAYHPASLAHQHAAVSACLGDRRSAIAALHESIRSRPASERRSRAITLARLAELQLAEGWLEQACMTWGQFLDDYPYLRSGRADAAVATLKSSTLPHRNNPVTRMLLRRVAAMGSGCRR